jgi:hypothetical protein
MILSENDYNLAISEITSSSINLIHDINLIMNGQFPDKKNKLKRPIKPARELLDLFKAKFKDNEIYNLITDVRYG